MQTLNTLKTAEQLDRMARLKSQVRYLDMLQQAENMAAKPVQLGLAKGGR